MRFGATLLQMRASQRGRYRVAGLLLGSLLAKGCFLDTGDLTSGGAGGGDGLGGSIQSPGDEDASVPDSSNGGAAGASVSNGGGGSGGAGGSGGTSNGGATTGGSEPDDFVEPDPLGSDDAGSGGVGGSAAVGEPDPDPVDSGMPVDSGAPPAPDSGSTSGLPDAGCFGAECGLCDGTCASGSCEPKVLVNGIGSAEGINRLVPWGETLFYTDLAMRRIIQLQPTPLEPDVTAEGLSAESIALDANNSILYLYDAGGPLRYCTLDSASESCTPDNVVTVINTLAADLSRIAMHDSDVLLFDMVSDQHRIVNCNDNCRRPEMMQAPVELFQMGPTAGSLFVSSDDVLFATSETLDGEGRLQRFDFNSNQRATFSGVGDAPGAVYVTDSQVFWLQNALAGAVYRCSRPDCDDPIEVTTNDNIGGAAITFSSSLVVVGSDVYWTNANSVMRCNTESCDESSELVIGNLDSPTSIVATDQCLFWVDDAGSLWTVGLAN